MHKMMLAAAVALAFGCAAQAAPIEVTDTITGAPGAWAHNFSLTNNLGGTNVVYFFAVDLPTTSITASPALWGIADWDIPWNNTPYGGSSRDYLDPWFCLYCASPEGLPAGQTLGGFVAADFGATPQLLIHWTAYAVDGDYPGPGCFYCGLNPGFEGVIGGGEAVPEPATWFLMLAGLSAAGAALRRRRAPLAAA